MRHEKAPGTLVVVGLVGRILLAIAGAHAGAVIVTPVRVGTPRLPYHPRLCVGLCALVRHILHLWRRKPFLVWDPDLSHCIRAHILSIFGQSASLSEAGARRAGCWCGTPDLLELVASRSAIDLLFRRGLLVSGKLGFVTMVFSL